MPTPSELDTWRKSSQHKGANLQRSKVVSPIFRYCKNVSSSYWVMHFERAHSPTRTGITVSAEERTIVCSLHGASSLNRSQRRRRRTAVRGLARHQYETIPIFPEVKKPSRTPIVKLHVKTPRYNHPTTAAPSLMPYKHTSEDVIRTYTTKTIIWATS